MPDENEFLSRWSKRKLSGEVAETDAPDPELDTAAIGAGHQDPGDDAPAPETEESDSEEEVPPELADIDIDSLDYDSDYTLFMKDNVPEALKRRALRQLWRSNPVLANVDGLNDYDDDFTDAALVVKGLQSAYKIGKGYLTDEELEENAKGGEDDLVSEAEDAPEGETGGTDTAQADSDDQEPQAGDAEDKPDESVVVVEADADHGGDGEAKVEAEAEPEPEPEDTRTV